MKVVVPVLLLLFLSSVLTQIQVNVNVGNASHAVSPTLFGIFFEEINHAGDGGLYGELVQNRAFDNQPNKSSFTSWSVIQPAGTQVSVVVDPQNPLNSESKYSAKITAGSANTGLANSGYWGICVKPDTYSLSFFVKNDDLFTTNNGQLSITLESQDASKVYAKVTAGPFTQQFAKQSYSLIVPSGVSDPNARLAIRVTAPGTVWLDVISVFPSTFNNRPNGLRKDLANLLVELSPKFLRFPGGNFVEGNNAQSAFLWKNTLGPVESRPGHMGVWGYWSSDGLGLLEYLIFCEDLKMEPIWVVSLGIFLGDGAIPINEIEPWIQDALDSLEYITGPSTSKWGSVRAQNGHPNPFDLKILALGNENGCSFDKNHIYVQYYNAFATRIKAAYPKLRLLANCDISGSTKNVDIFDYHVYSTTTWFLQNTGLWDKQSRTGPSVFVSEYAVTQDVGNGNLQAAVAEAAFMTGLVRNSDIVELASYAPLFVNVNDRRWNPDIIQFDNYRTAPTPSYYVQQLFAKYTGDKVLHYNVANGNTNFAAVATLDTAKKLIYIPVVNFTPFTTSVDINLTGSSSVGSQGVARVLTSPTGNPKDENSLVNPTLVSITTTSFTAGPKFSYKMSPYSVTILQIPSN